MVVIDRIDLIVHPTCLLVEEEIDELVTRLIEEIEPSDSRLYFYEPSDTMEEYGDFFKTFSGHLLHDKRLRDALENKQSFVGKIFQKGKLNLDFPFLEGNGYEAAPVIDVAVNGAYIDGCGMVTYFELRSALRDIGIRSKLRPLEGIGHYLNAA